MSRSSLLRALPLVLLFAGACGKDTTTTPTETTTTTATATVTATAAPDTVIVSASNDASYAWRGSFTVTLTNTNTTPITIRSVTTDLQQSSGGIVITPAVGTDEAFRYDMRAPGNRIDTNGSMAIPFTFYYTLPNGGRESMVNLAFSVVTDGGATGSVTATVSFQ